MSPVVFYLNGLKFHFYANEGNPREDMHIHVDRGDAKAKYWLYPDVQLASSWGYNRRELRLILKLVEARRDEIAGAWNAFFRTGPQI